MKIRIVIVLMALTTIASGTTYGQAHHHEHGGADEDTKPVQRPKVFLDKSSRIVWYQLNRLDNERLLLVERKTDNAKYAPVFTAILTRAGMSPQYREEALAGGGGGARARSDPPRPQDAGPEWPRGARGDQRG